MKMERYINTVKRKLNMPGDVKKRVMNDFVSSIEARREDGMTDEQIFAELGTPAKAAADLNEQMKEYCYEKSPWRWVCLVLIIGCCLSLILGGWTGIVTYLVNNTVGMIGGADGPTAIFIATSPDAQQQQLIITLVLLVMGIVGFWCLSRMKKNKE